MQPEWDVRKANFNLCIFLTRIKWIQKYCLTCTMVSALGHLIKTTFETNNSTIYVFLSLKCSLHKLLLQNPTPFFSRCCWGRYLGLGGSNDRLQKANDGLCGCITQEISFWWRNQGGWDNLAIWHVWGRSETSMCDI